MIKSTHKLDVESSIAFNTWVSGKKVEWNLGSYLPWSAGSRLAFLLHNRKVRLSILRFDALKTKWSQVRNFAALQI
jgi:hypothetical protein